jgi:hypothetical protein
MLTLTQGEWFTICFLVRHAMPQAILHATPLAHCHIASHPVLAETVATSTYSLILLQVYRLISQVKCHICNFEQGLEYEVASLNVEIPIDGI